MKHFQNCTRKVLASFLILLLLPILPGVSCAEDLKVLTLPGSLTTVAQEAFRGDTSLEKVILQEGITSIQSLAFADCSLEEIVLPASLTYIAEDAFENIVLHTMTAPKGSYAYQWGREHRYITEYRALLIGETKFIRNNELTYVNRNANDVKKMAAKLNQIYGPTGEKYQVTQKTNLRRTALKSAIQTTFAGTMDHDISLFFIATHGKSDGDGDLEMPYNGDLNDTEYWEGYFDEKCHYLPFDTLANWLSTMVNGKVIVILESCGSGSAIYEENGTRKRGAKTEDDLSEDFVQAAVKAFAKADPGIVTSLETNSESNRKSTGVFRQPKFYVLAAAKHQEESWGYNNEWPDPANPDPVNLFTMWLIDGIGIKGNSPADDAPQDGVLTLNELYKYILSVERKQHVQVYPEGSDQAIFLLK